MKKTLLAAIISLALVAYSSAQEPNRSTHQGETFVLRSTLPNDEDHTYTASNYIKLLPGFKSNPNDEKTSLLNLGLDPLGIYPPDQGYTNNTGDVVGSLGGTVGVGTMGGLNYTIPIDLPKGINGMQPNVTINYNNQGGNGLLGWCWDLGAFSRITRTGQTLYHDGQMTGVDFTKNDRFLLDGQRLIVVSGAYGSTGSEYRTENDCMSRIRLMVDTQASNKTYFKVWDRSGNILEYKETLFSPDRSKEIMWILSKVTDRYGNSMVYHYVTNDVTGESRLDNIEYTFNEEQGVEAQFQVKFDYNSDRLDYELYYVGGCQLLHRDRLESIKVIQKSSNKTLSLYEFEYIEEMPTNTNDIFFNHPNRIYYILKLIKLKVYGEDGSFEQVNTKINKDNTSPYTVDKYPISNPNILVDFPFMGDFNGDGYTDLAMVPYKKKGQNNYDEPQTIKVFLNDRNHGFTRASSFDMTVDETLDWIYILDIDDDGLDDIVFYYFEAAEDDNKASDNTKEKTTIRIYKNSGHHFYYKDELEVKNKAFVVTGDFDGNGTADVVLLERKKRDVYHWNNSIIPPFTIEKVTYIENIFWMGYQNSSYLRKRLNRQSLNRKLGPTYDVVSFDCNGDQTNEVLLVGFDDDYYTNYGTKLARFDFSNSNEGINILETYTDPMRGYPFDCPHSKWSNIFPGDFNGDGKTDLLYSNCGQWSSCWHIWFSNGNTMNRPLFVDNNDNSLYDHQGLPNLDTYTNLFPPSLSQMGIVYDNHNLMFSVADFDGDGCTDVCFSYGSNRYLFIASKIKADLDGQSVTFRKRQKLDILFNFKSQYTHVGNFLGRDNFSMLESISNNAYIIAPASVNRYNSVESITDGLGNTTSFTYDYLMPKSENNDDNFYSFNYHIEDQYGVRPIPVPTLALKTYKVEGINGSSVISKYSYSQARFHKKGHGFIGFKSATTETYKNSLTLPWKSRKTTWYNGEVLSSHGMLLPVREESYINCNETAHLIGETIYEFDKVILSSNNTNLVVCPALRALKEDTYSLDDGYNLIKTVETKYDYDYNTDNTYTTTYGCTKTTQTVTGYEDGQSHVELVTQTTTAQTTIPNKWIINRPDEEKTILTRNNESTASFIKYEYDSDNTYQPNKVTVYPNDGSQLNDRLTTVTHYSYDEFGNATDVVTEAPFGQYGEQPRSVHYQYGNNYQHRLVTKEIHGEESDGYYTIYKYDFHDRQRAVSDCNGKTVILETSPLGITQKTFSFDRTEQRTVTLWAANSPYKPAGASYYTWSKKTGGVTTMTFYHKTGLELRNVTFDFDGNPIFADKRYNDLGLLEQESAPYKQGESEDNIQWTTYAYDNLERIKRTLYPDGTESQTEYHGLKTISKVVPLEGDPQKSVAILNAMGWPKQKIDAYDTEHPTSVHYEYYPDGNLKWTRINDDETTKIRLEYDHAGNRTLLHDPDYCIDKKDLVSVYNAFGEEVSTTSPRELTTTYLYDQFGRMTQRTENEPLVDGGTESRTTVWTYYEDAASGKKGLLHTIAYPGQTITYSYDDCQRVRKEEAEFDSGESYITRYTYDEAARKAHVLYPSGYYVHYHYNDIGHFRSITDSNGNEIYRTEKTTPLGQTERFVMAGNIVSTREYHPEKHTLTHIHTAKGENILQNLRYDYDGFGNLAFRKDETRHLEEHFEYDHLNRLKVIKRGIMITGTMEYDPYGRMTKKVSDNTIIFSDARYDINTKPHAIDEASCGFGVIPEEEQNITYTCFDKVKTITEGGNTLAYTYGYDRQRIFMEEHANGVDRTKRYVGSCEFLTTTTGGSTTTKALTYLSSPTGIFAVVETEGDGKHTLHYVLKDHLGSWSTITDCNGAVEQELSYDAWGNRRDPDTWRRNWYNPALEEPMFDRGYTGHEHLYAFGLINMNGRCYDPVMSSFLSVDAYVQSPDNSQNFNRYAYCLNNPLKYIDPSGWTVIGGGMGSHTTGAAEWGTNYAPVYEPRDFGLLELTVNAEPTIYHRGNELKGGGGGCSNSGDGGESSNIKGGQTNNTSGNESQKVSTVEPSTPDDPPGGKNDNGIKKNQDDINKTGILLTIFGGAAKIADEATIGASALLQTTFEVSGAITGIAIIVNARINYFRYRNGEISYYSMFARDGVTLIEAAIARAPYGIGVIPSIALTAYDIGGGFEQTLYNDAWVKTQIHYWNQQLYQYRPDPGYQPIYYRHGK